MGHGWWRQGRSGNGRGQRRGVAKQPSIGDLDDRGWPVVRGELLDRQPRAGDYTHILAPDGNQDSVWSLGW